MAVAEIKSYWARAKAEAAGLWANKWGRRAIVAVGVLALGWIAILLLFARDLPSTEALLAYEPPLPSHVRAIDGTPIHEFARERRVYLTYDELPATLIEAFISAEDKTFFSHGGLDYPGIVSDVVDKLTSHKEPRAPPPHTPAANGRQACAGRGGAYGKIPGVAVPIKQK